MRAHRTQLARCTHSERVGFDLALENRRASRMNAKHIMPNVPGCVRSCFWLKANEYEPSELRMLCGFLQRAPFIVQMSEFLDSPRHGKGRQRRRRLHRNS